MCDALSIVSAGTKLYRKLNLALCYVSRINCTCWYSRRRSKTLWFFELFICSNSPQYDYTYLYYNLFIVDALPLVVRCAVL